MADDVYRDLPPRYPVSAGTREDGFSFHKVSWGAIWAGVMVTLGLEALFLSFGIFIGAAFGGSAAWNGIWYLITAFVSFYAGARTAARLSDIAVRDICTLHGLTTWGLATLASLILGGLVGMTVFAKSVTPLYALNFWGGATFGWAGMVWGGALLSLIAAYIGGSQSTPILHTGSGLTGSTAQVPPAPLRRVS